MTEKRDPERPDDNVGEVPTRWEHAAWRRGMGAADYQKRFDDLEARGSDVHGEADFVARLVPRPARVLDAGCGTGRVATRLTELGYRCTGVDVDPEMIAVARERDHVTRFLVADLADLAIPGQSFDLAVLAGNVVPLLRAGTLTATLRRLAAHIESEGWLVTGFGLDPGSLPPGSIPLDLAVYDRAARAAGFAYNARYATWSGTRFTGGDYAVNVHRKR